MNQSNRKRKGRPRGRSPASGSGTAAEHQALASHEIPEDAQTFWARSNARLGIDPGDAQAGRKGALKQLVEMPCAVCGTIVMCDRPPRSHQDVICDGCRGALGQLIHGEERSEAIAVRRMLNPSRTKNHEGIPAFTEEDLDALDEAQSRSELGTGRNSNKRGTPARRRRKKVRTDGNERSAPRGNGGGRGERTERGQPQGGGGAPASEGASGPGGEEGRKRRRRRRRRKGEGEGGGGDSAGSAAGSEG